ncbi:MAG: tetratricopeptide repeat protein [Chloroflexaceae bacterium]|nr:tetratricopeptide repeat protein [Chloroflexaceae bacterium]
MINLYAGSVPQPEGWREVLMWHWEQAGDNEAALNTALEVAELCVERLAFSDARGWVERAMKLLETLPTPDQNEQGEPTEISPRNVGKHAYEIRAYSLMIAILEFHGQYREALEYVQLLLRLVDEHEDFATKGRTYLTSGRMLRELGHLAAAETELGIALKLAEEHEMAELQAECHLHQAKVHQLQGRHLEAFQQLELAHHISSKDNARMARIWTGIGDVYRVLGAVHESLRLYDRALKQEIDTNNRIGQAMLHDKLGLSYLSLGQTDQALLSAREALRLREELDDTLGLARSHSTLGTININLGNHAEALTHFELARQYEAALQSQRGLTIALTNLGDAARTVGEYAQARASYTEALALARDVNDQVALARIHERMGDLCEETGVHESALAHWAQALGIRESLGHSEESMLLRNRIATGLAEGET